MSRASWIRLTAVLALVAGAELAWYGTSLWDFSDGVYLKSAQLLLDGHAPYADVVAAQPPGIYYAGAALLSVSGSIWWVRAALSVLAVGTALLVGQGVLRLSGDRVAAAAGAVATLLTPWFLREHLTLTPETLATPLLLAAALGCTSRRWAALAGVMAAAAVACKVSFVVPAAALVLVAPQRARFRTAAGGTLVVGVLGSLALWGDGLLDDAVRAQREVGTQLSLVPGYGAQAVWSLAALAVGAGLLWARRDRVADPAFGRVALGLAVGSALLVGTLLKRGTYLNVLSGLEPVLVLVAVPGLVLALRDGGARRALAVAAVALAALQSGSLLADPDDPALFARPFSAAKLGRALAPGAVHREVDAARACPPGTAYAGGPYVAFVADVPMPGDQPDLFLLGGAPKALAGRAGDQSAPRCPAPPRPGA